MKMSWDEKEDASGQPLVLFFSLEKKKEEKKERTHHDVEPTGSGDVSESDSPSKASVAGELLSRREDGLEGSSSGLMLVSVGVRCVVVGEGSPSYRSLSLWEGGGVWGCSRASNSLMNRRRVV